MADNTDREILEVLKSGLLAGGSSSDSAVLAEIESNTDGIEASLTTIDGRVDGVEASLTTITGHVDGIEAGQTTGNASLATLVTQGAGQPYTRVQSAALTQANNGTVELIAAGGGSNRIKLRGLSISFVNSSDTADDVIVTIQDADGTPAVLHTVRLAANESINQWVEFGTVRPQSAANVAVNMVLAGTAWTGRIVAYYELGT